MSDFSDLPATFSPQQALGVVAPPRLWDGDDPAGYDLLQAQISGSLGPKDFLEEIWTRDVVDLGDLSPAADQRRPYARRRPQGCAQGLLARLVPLNRYEQRALVRRQFAIKEFDRVDRNERRWAKNNVVFLGSEPNG